LSFFATIHFPDRQTDRPNDTQTDRWDKQQISKNNAYVRYTDREQCANNGKYG